jgi:hypothetical protein
MATTLSNQTGDTHRVGSKHKKAIPKDGFFVGF